jgi:hypothetical protein
LASLRSKWNSATLGTRCSIDIHFEFNLEITRSMEPEQLRDDQYCSLSESKRICGWPAGTGTIPAEPACRRTAGCRRLMAASAYSAALGHFLSSGPAGDADDPAGDADDN